MSNASIHGFEYIRLDHAELAFGKLRITTDRHDESEKKSRLIAAGAKLQLNSSNAYHWITLVGR